MKKKIIAAAVLLVLGIGSLIGSRVGNPFAQGLILTDDSVGTTVRAQIGEGYLSPSVKYSETLGVFTYDYDMWHVFSEDGELVRVIVTDELRDSLDLMNIFEYSLTITGNVNRAPQEMKDELSDTIIGYYEMMDEDMGEVTMTEERKEMIREMISDYYIELTGVDYQASRIVKTSLCVAGAVLIAASVILLISAISRKPAKKIILVIAIAVAVLATILALIVLILFHKHIGIMSDIRKDDKGVYYMEYKEELLLDDMLSAGITSDDELISWLGNAEYHGISPITLDPGRYGCSSFAARTPDGDILLGRNFDYPETDTVMIYTDPQDGYASYAMADLAVLGIGRGMGQIDPDSPLGRFMMTTTPYVVVDGVNEEGLAASILVLTTEENHQDNGKPDLFVYTAIRVILDRCANVDEAIAFLDSYDIHSHNNESQHLFIVDRSGRSVVIEWFGNEMYVNELSAVTNSVLTPGEYYGDGSDNRLGILTEGLEENGGVLTPEQARDLLEAVSFSSWTEWSSVYNLNDFTADIYTDVDYSHAYHYGN